MSKLIRKINLDKDLFDLNIVDTVENETFKIEGKPPKTLPFEEKKELEKYFYEIRELAEKQDNYTKYIKESLTSAYQTFTLILFMFLGYLITGFKYFGFSIWKDKTTIIFYAILSASALIIFLMEVKRDNLNPNRENKEDKE